MSWTKSSAVPPQKHSISSLTGDPVVRSSNTLIPPVLLPSFVFGTNLDDAKWDGRLVALGMAQGTYPMENVTSAKFRIFLAERAINYVFVANVPPNVLLTNTNIGCPNISFGPSISPLFFLLQIDHLYPNLSLCPKEKY
jgi:hypothetical protein